MKKVLTLLGSSSICAVRLQTPEASRFHASLLRTPLGVWVIDLLAKGGIKVNDRRVRSARLEDRDELQIGSHLIRLRYLPTATAPGPVADPPRIEDAGVASTTESASHMGNRSPVSAAAEMELSRPPEALPEAPLPVESTAPLPLPGRELVPLLVEQSLDGAKVSESLVLPLLSHFGQMQNQMFDQMHQSMMMMVQMLGELHRDQMETVRAELDRVQKITQELQSLQTELAKRSLAAASMPVPRIPAPAPVLPWPPPTVAGNGTQPEGVGPQPARGGPDPLPGAPGAMPAAPAHSGEDPHEWLNRRIAAIQQERQTSWQKILGFLRGKRAEDTRP
jgi:hypothetical protein